MVSETRSEVPARAAVARNLHFARIARAHVRILRRSLSPFTERIRLIRTASGRDGGTAVPSRAMLHVGTGRKFRAKRRTARVPIIGSLSVKETRGRNGKVDGLSAGTRIEKRERRTIRGWRGEREEDGGKRTERACRNLPREIFPAHFPRDTLALGIHGRFLLRSNCVVQKHVGYRCVINLVIWFRVNLATRGT